MLIRFEEITRGGGKIFIHLCAEGVPQNSQLVVCASSAAGASLPSSLLAETDIDGYVLVIAVLSVEQKVCVSVRDEAGREVASFLKTIKPLQAKLSSQINTAFKNKTAELIRNCDQRIRSDGITVEVRDVIADSDGTDIVHGTISATSMSRESIEAPIDIQVLDTAGKSAAARPWIALGDSVSQSSEYSGGFVRSIGFSVRIPRTLRTMVVWATSSTEAVPDGFDTVEWFRLREMRENWNFQTLSADRDPYYDEWFRKFHRADERALSVQRVYRFETQPMFSIIVPLYNTPIDFLCDMVESVLAQTYAHFELILVNASPHNRGLAEVVADYTRRDKRIKLLELSENLGITENTNRGIEAAGGDFLCFLDHDDVIKPDLLFCYAKGVNDYPTTDLLYCDEDKLRNGKYCSPFFKPDWNPDLLCSVNYVCHMLAVRKSVADGLPSATKEFDGAQDHNLTFLVAEKARNIYHVRRSLYHWRIHEHSTASSAAAKCYTSDAGVRAIQGHLIRSGIEGVAMAREEAPNTYRIDYRFDRPPLVSIVIPNKDMTTVLDRCVRSILEKSSYDNYEVVIVENNSTEAETFSYYKYMQKQNEHLRVIVEKTDGGFNFSKTINFGFSAAKGEYLLMLNNDVEVISPNWMESLLGPCMRDDVGAVGAKLLFPDGTIQHAGVGIHRDGPGHIGRFLPAESHDYYNLVSLAQDYTAVTGACLMTKRSTFDRAGKLDETLAVDYNDIDYCLRLRKIGLHVVYAPDALLYHYESVSRGEHDSKEKKIRFARENGLMMMRWPEYWALGDPYLSPSIAPGNMYHHLV